MSFLAITLILLINAINYTNGIEPIVLVHGTENFSHVSLINFKFSKLGGAGTIGVNNVKSS